MNRLTRCTVLLALLAFQGCASLKLPDTAARTALAAKVAAPDTGAADVRATQLDDGGLAVTGTLEGKTFSVAFPIDWNGEGALVFAHGYTAPGSPSKVPEDLLAEDPAQGILKYAYLQGYAVGAASYDKAGLGIQTGVQNTWRLKQYLDRVGAKHVYVSGASMGGNIVVTLLEQHPGAFAGGLAVCGATNNFGEVVGRLIDMRAVYDYYTMGTAYELPGTHDLNVSAVRQELPWALSWAQKPWGLWQAKRIYDPIVALFTAARDQPKGKEAQLIARISAITGWAADPAAFAMPLLTITKGMDDLSATAGGHPYDNTARVYSAPGMTATEVTDLNRGVARIKGDPQALAYMAQWHTASGQFDTPLVTMHNSIDALVPFTQTIEFGKRVAAAKNQAHLAQLTVPPMRRILPMSDLEGYMHCGFRPDQTGGAWDELRRWVEQGQKPVDGMRK